MTSTTKRFAYILHILSKKRIWKKLDRPRNMDKKDTYPNMYNYAELW